MILSTINFSNINFTSLAGLTAIGAVIATGWRYIASFGRYLVGLVIGTAVLKDDTAFAVMAYTFNNSLRSPLGTRVFGGFESYVHTKRWRESVAYEGIGTDSVLIKYKRSFALLSLMDISKVSGEVGEVDNKLSLLKIRYFKWFFNIENFVLDSLEYYNNEKRNNKKESRKQEKKQLNTRFKIIRYAGQDMRAEVGNKNKSQPTSPTGFGGTEEMIRNGIYKLLKWKREDLQIRPEDGKSPFTGYPFPKEVEIAIKELELWLTSEKWFRSKSIPWRRGWLLHGIPGTGKSTLTRALGMSFDLPVYIFDLNGMTNDDLVHHWDEMMSNTPCIALIEDIDNVFDGRKYVGSTGTNMCHLTFDCLLNCISGVKQSDGVFLIVTTNHIEKLDPAIGIPDENGKSSRPGRIDKALELGLMGDEQRLQLANHILSDYPDLIQNIVKDGNGETPAQFQSRCASIALDKFWKDKKSNRSALEEDENMERGIVIGNYPITDVAENPYPGMALSPSFKRRHQ